MAGVPALTPEGILGEITGATTPAQRVQYILAAATVKQAMAQEAHTAVQLKIATPIATADPWRASCTEKGISIPARCIVSDPQTVCNPAAWIPMVGDQPRSVILTDACLEGTLVQQMRAVLTQHYSAVPLESKHLIEDVLMQFRLVSQLYIAMRDTNPEVSARPDAVYMWNSVAVPMTAAGKTLNALTEARLAATLGPTAAQLYADIRLLEGDRRIKTDEQVMDMVARRIRDTPESRRDPPVQHVVKKCINCGAKVEHVDRSPHMWDSHNKQCLRAADMKQKRL